MLAAAVTLVQQALQIMKLSKEWHAHVAFALLHDGCFDGVGSDAGYNCTIEHLLQKEFSLTEQWQSLINSYRNMVKWTQSL